MLNLFLGAFLASSGLVECKVVSGSVFSCEAVGYQGEAVVQHNGYYRRCKIVNGNVTTCGGSYQGIAPAYSSGKWKVCKIVNGKIFSCGAHYHGKVVTQR